MIVDLNGEEWRAKELGGALARLGPRMTGCRLSTPATSLGECGAASGGVGLCMAIRAFEREYAASSQSIVASMSDSGAFSAIRIDRGLQAGNAQDGGVRGGR